MPDRVLATEPLASVHRPSTGRAAVGTIGQEATPTLESGLTSMAWSISSSGPRTNMRPPPMLAACCLAASMASSKVGEVLLGVIGVGDGNSVLEHG